ncbi:CPBP family intramembrane glutamic endopeptidase [Flavobacterium sp. ZS1P70]|uniref:CPBP family intramembrane glutamic endopeptidase n=1 Tax=Flavobacterium zhoui TaxID=3230414 RepID=A0ABW6I6G5_9FLAO
MVDYLKTTKKSVLIGGILFLLLILFTVAASFQLLEHTNFSKQIKFSISRLAIWGCLFLLYIYSIKMERQPFLLWTEEKYSLIFFLKSVAKLMFSLFLIMLVVYFIFKIADSNIDSKKMNEIMKLFKNNIFLILFTSITAGVTEELIFRGYLIPRLEILLKNTPAAILISSILFGLIHYSYGTLIQIIGPVFIGLLFAVYYQKYKNIKILIMCHFLWDLLVLLNKTSQLQ